jgi:signal transduction histidine kinase
MRPYLPAILRGALGLFLILSTAAVLYTTAQNTRIAQSLADQALESTALSLSSSAEMELRLSGARPGDPIRRLFSDRVVAYALIAKGDGTVLFHTNPALAGSNLSEKGLKQWLQSGKASGRRTFLRTGLPVFEFNYILHRPDGQAELLRLVLHTTSADLIISQSERIWWTVGLVLIILWTIGILLERMFSRQLRLGKELEEKRQLAVIGQMTAVLSHEIRNALGGIKGFTQWVDEKTEASDPKKEALAFVLKGTDRIESLVNDLLLFSKEESYERKALDIAPLVEEVIALEFQDKKDSVVDINLEQGLRVWGDAGKLHRVLLNGFQNALQAAERPSGIRVTGRSRGKWAEIRIEDSGPGIPANEFPLLFTPFHTTKPDGTGLGLAYSRKVISGMGGRIELVNREDRKGAALAIRLPRVEKE